MLSILGARTVCSGIRRKHKDFNDWAEESVYVSAVEQRSQRMIREAWVSWAPRWSDTLKGKRVHERKPSRCSLMLCLVFVHVSDLVPDGVRVECLLAQELHDRRDRLSVGDLLLLPRLHVPQNDRPALHLHLAEQQGVARLELIGEAHLALEARFAERSERVDTLLAQVRNQGETLLLRFGTELCDENVYLILVRHLDARLLHLPDHALHPAREAHAGRRFAAEELDQSIVPSAASDGILRTGFLVPELEDRLGVVVQSADEAGIFDVGDLQFFEVIEHRRVVLLAFGGEELLEGGRALEEDLCVALLGVEQAQGIRRQALAVELREIALLADEVIPQRVGVGLAVLGGADVVDVQLHALEELQVREDLRDDVDELRVETRVLESDHFQIELVELPVAALLRPVVAEALADGVELDRLRQLLHAGFHEGAADARREFRAQGGLRPLLVPAG